MTADWLRKGDRVQVTTGRYAGSFGIVRTYQDRRNLPYVVDLTGLLVINGDPVDSAVTVVIRAARDHLEASAIRHIRANVETTADGVGDQP